MDEIKQALIKAIQNRVEIAFGKSQQVVPVVTGALRRSGNEKDIDAGASIIYSQNYASFVERGTKAGIRNVQGYYRKGGAYVKPHSYFSNGQEPKYFIRNSMQESFSSFADAFDIALRDKFGSRVQRG